MNTASCQFPSTHTTGKVLYSTSDQITNYNSSIYSTVAILKEVCVFSDIDVAK